MKRIARILVARLETSVAYLCWWTGITDYLIRRNQALGRIPIVTYHSVYRGTPFSSLRRAGMVIPARRFEEHLKAFSSRFMPMTVSEYLAAREDPMQTRRAIVITFDDGLLDNFELTALLERFSIKATFFLIGRHLENEYASLPLLYARADASEIDNGAASARGLIRQFRAIAMTGSSAARAAMNEEFEASVVAPFEERYMTVEQAHGLLEKGHEIGLHGYDHVLLSALSDDDLNDEMTRATVSYAEMFPQSSSPCFAFPYGMPGTVGSRESQAMGRFGVRCALTTEEKLATSRCHRFGLPRIQMDNVPVATALFRLTGLRGWFKVPLQRWIWRRQTDRPAVTQR